MKVLILGAGGIGRATAAALVRRGHEATVASRTGAPSPDHPTLRVDAVDRSALTRAAAGFDVVVNAMNPQSYLHWDRDWPPAASAVLHSVRATQGRLVTISNLYAYGRVDRSMTEESPLLPNGVKGEVRKQMWLDALAEHNAGTIKATELRASDYFGPGVGPKVSFLQNLVLSKVRAGRNIALPIGDPQAPHTWTYVEDIGELAAVLATDDRAWGRAWHVPSAAPRSFCEVADDGAKVLGAPTPTVKLLPGVVRTMLRLVPIIRAIDETRHQFEAPFVMDSTAAQQVFGLRPTPWLEALETTLMS